MQQDIEKLLHEAQRAKFTERRTEPRHPFVRPVKIFSGGEAPLAAFSKDLSKQGIGVVTEHAFEPEDMAVLTIHSTTHQPVHIKCRFAGATNSGPAGT